MIDWKRLFENSRHLYGGSVPLSVYEVPPDDTQWIATETNKYTFEETDPLKIAIDTLKEQRTSAVLKLENQARPEEMSSEAMDELFDEIKELVELSNANNIGLARLGGLQALLEIMVAHGDDGVRKNAAQVFNAVTGNNLKVQSFAVKTGAINLAA